MVYGLEKFKEYFADYTNQYVFIGGTACKQPGIVLKDNESGYPMLLDGAETTPTEDVGGIYGFYGFMTVYRDKRHPEHEAMKA